MHHLLAHLPHLGHSIVAVQARGLADILGAHAILIIDADWLSLLLLSQIHVINLISWHIQSSLWCHIVSGNVHVSSSHHVHLLIHALNLNEALHVILGADTLALSVDAKTLHSGELVSLSLIIILWCGTLVLVHVVL